MKYSPKALNKFISTKYLESEYLNQDVQNLSQGRKYVKFFTQKKSDLEIHAFFGFTGTIFLEKGNCKKSVLCLVENQKGFCWSLKVTVYFDLNDTIFRTEISTAEIDNKIEDELD